MRRLLQRGLTRAMRARADGPARAGAHLIHIETAHRVDGRLVLAGWSTAGEVALAMPDGTPFDVALRMGREDVRAHAAEQGIAVVERPALVALGPRAPMPERLDAVVEGVAATVHPPRTTALPGALAEHLTRMGFAPKALAEAARGAGDTESLPDRDRASIDHVLTSPADGATVVAGWALATPGTRLRVEASDGATAEAEQIVHHPRADVLEGFGLSPGIEPGLLAYLPPGRRGRTVRIVAVSEGRSRTLARSGPTDALSADAVAAARTLFALPGREAAFRARAERIDLPVLQPLVDAHAARALAATVHRETVGHPPPEPEASLIVPLHGRDDFVEHQMIEFSRDPWLRARAELVYVVDDPRLIEGARTRMRRAAMLWDMPATMVWTGTNGGYAVANRIGVAAARGPRLLFLNSDVVPRAAGWLERMVETLEGSPGAGAVGARLLFASGGLQHVGMTFAHDARLGIWVNRHPMLGVTPADVPMSGPVEVVAATGACLLLRRSDHDAAGGWDTGYLIGDFEDSDLCLSLRDRGQRILVEPRATLVHLERQSVGRGEADGMRMRTTILNAVRHEARWGGTLARLAEAGR
nr:glycosyltransferase [Jannaschia sp. Os4]